MNDLLYLNKENIRCEYYNKFKRSHFLSDLYIIYNKFKINFKIFDSKKFSVCGRIFSKRIMGKSIFIDIKDFSGKIQLYINKKNINNYNLISFLNLGDIVGVKGTIIFTKTKEFSLKVDFLYLLSKNYMSFPDKKFGIIDKEISYRKRYLDLLVNDISRNKFFIRFKIISKIREFFLSMNFIEVETPIIQLLPGGADAKPFETFHNYLGYKMFLRISPELYLKKLIVGGFDGVFEIGKIFRNEGFSTRHHPEFTSIEFYKAYLNYKDLMLLTENLFTFLVKSVFNSYTCNYNGINLNFSLPFKKIDFLDSIISYTNIEKNNLFNVQFLYKFCLDNNLNIEKNLNIFELQYKIFETFVEDKLIEPIFIMHHPVDISPLARKINDNINFTERFELYICGKEIANGFSELNDPFDQLERFTKQLNKDNLIKSIDYDFIEALKYGLPPTAGEGIGIDRLVMLFTNSLSIKDVILFPIMKIDKFNYE